MPPPSPYRPAREWPIPPMDKQAGWKDSAFTWEMGELILQRIAEGESVRAITAHPDMPAYCTVFRWMQVVPEFGEAVAEVRGQLAQQRQALADAWRHARGRRRNGAGRREQVSAQALGRLLDAVRDGASVSAAVAEPGAPSFKALYSRVRKCPAFRAAFVDACEWRDIELEVAREEALDGVFVTGIPAANAALRAIDGRRGRLRPKLYRRLPPGPSRTGDML
ncbi:hypothetical protein [Phenylobacterium sp.]|uniref:terminase small subunit-like protein n=1 Tax=Phenylobacterium sp. TaxID=1871053 RepID=UPI003BAD16BB